MPSGRVHTAINLGAAIPLAYAAHRALAPSHTALSVGIVAFVFATFLLGPDIDLHESSPSHRWHGFQAFWFLYPKLFHHRGLSHSLLFGSLTRFVYIGGMVLFLTGAGLWGYTYFSPTEAHRVIASAHAQAIPTAQLVWLQLNSHRDLVVAAFAGIWASDTLHVVADRLYSASKQVFRI